MRRRFISSKNSKGKQYLTIEALEDGLAASLSLNACEYCIDNNGIWMTLNPDVKTQSINRGQTLSFRCNPNASNTSIGTFTITKKCNLSGNCMSMLFDGNCNFNETFYNFAGLFENCINIIEVSENLLPSTKLSKGCYSRMFSGCTSLTTAPKLPATTLADNCYENMFIACTSLATAPELPATSLCTNCYYGMFRGCTSLVTAPNLYANIVAEQCCYDMFYGCTSLTTAPEKLLPSVLYHLCYANMFANCTSLTTPPELPATTLAGSCYYKMFYGCTSLTNAPNLPAIHIYNSCYRSMFEGCTLLSTVPELPATDAPPYCYHRMFYGCISLLSAPDLPATTIGQYCYSEMFRGCTSLTIAPKLPATTLASDCYNSMFSGCSKLNYVKAMFTTVPGEDYTQYWLSGVASTGTFVKNKDATWFVTGASGVPNGWDVVFEECVFKLVDINNLIILNNQPFDEGMTWQEFANSDYNIDNKLKISSYGTVVYDGRPVKDKAEPVSLNDIIKPTNYLLDAYGSGGSGGGN